MTTSKGGLVGKIPDSKIFDRRDIESISDKIESFYNYLKITPVNGKSEKKFFGSYNFGIQPYFGDIDTRNLVFYNLHKKEAIKQAMLDIQNVVRKLNNNKLGRFFTDMKCGMYDDGEAVHWTAEEVLNGKRNGKKPDFNGHKGEKKLIDAIGEIALCKIDMVTPYNNRYIEVTVVYDLFCLDGSIGHIEPTNEILIEQLKRDILKQLKKNKYFKIIKRLYSISTYTKDFKTARILAPLLISNVSKLSMINSDLSTLQLLMRLKKKVNTNIVKIELERIKEMLGNILDIDFQGKLDDIYKLMDYTYKSILEQDHEEAEILLDDITDYFQVITNNETLKYLRANNINVPYFKNAQIEYI